MSARRDKQIWKYIREQFSITVDFASRIKTNESVQDFDIESTNIDGVVVTGLVENPYSDPNDETKVGFTLSENGGEKGKSYYINVLVETETDKLEYIIQLDVV